MQQLQGQFLRKTIDDYVINYSIEVGMSSRTIQNKKDILQRLFLFLNGRSYTLATARLFTAELFQTWKTPNSRLDLVRILRAFTNFLQERGYIEESFAKELTKPKVPQQEFTYVAPEIVEQIITVGTEPSPPGVKGDNLRNRVIKAETRDALRTMLRTGLRISEVTGLKGSDIRIQDDPPSFLVTSKGGDRDLLPIPGDLIELFRSRIGRARAFPVTEKTCNLVLKRGLEKLKIKEKLTCHSLRHIFATNLVKNDVQMQKVQRLLRHESVETTNRMYTHLNVNDLSLIVNQQAIVREHLEVNQVFDLLIEAIKRTGVEKDSRFAFELKREGERISFQLESKQGNLSFTI